MKHVGRYQNKVSTEGYRKQLRKNSTKAEQVLWKKIRSSQLGIKFRRQYDVGYYIVDYYCHELRLVIEVDGWIHGEAEQVDYDKRRNHYLNRLGYIVLHYRNEQIKYELNAVVQSIIYTITRLQATKDPT